MDTNYSRIALIISVLLILTDPQMMDVTKSKQTCYPHYFDCFACHFIKRNVSWQEAARHCPTDYNFTPSSRFPKVLASIAHSELIFTSWRNMSTDCPLLTNDYGLWIGYFWNTSSREWLRNETSNSSKLMALNLAGLGSLMLSESNEVTPSTNTGRLLCGAIVLNKTENRPLLEARECSGSSGSRTVSGVFCGLKEVRRCLTNATASSYAQCTFRRPKKAANHPHHHHHHKANATFHCFQDSSLSQVTCNDSVNLIPLKCEGGPRYQCYIKGKIKNKIHSWVYVLLGFLVLACVLLLIMSCCLLVSGMRGTTKVNDARKSAEYGDFKDMQQSLANLRSDDMKKMQI